MFKKIKELLAEQHTIAESRLAMLGISRRGATGAEAALFAGALIVVVIGLALYPTVKAYVGNATLGSDSNTSLLNLIPTFWVFGVLGVSVAMAITAFKTGHK